jgi:hypothetical protein
MAYREFTDDRGREWKVWDVYPTLAERRLRTVGPPSGQRERRRLAQHRPRVQLNMEQGWLTFEARDGERRRLAPIPAYRDGWSTAPDEQLRGWCAAAAPAPAGRRLIE